MRVKIVLAYDGTSFLGSQKQKETSNTIFGIFESILSQLGIQQNVVASGRTDKGVHASYQVCHIDLPPFWMDIKKLQYVLNKMLPQSIFVKKIQKVSSDFHARYDATSRVYRYIIKEGQRDPFLNRFVTFVDGIDIQKISQNIKLFMGEHDFAYFMKNGSDVKSTIRVISKTFVYQHKGNIILYFEANGFLRSQIRLMVGALLQLNAFEIQQQLSLEKKI
ncbi:tRNA pseudouridine synthase A [hydrothermal vent metagenome]|uniref:tRNA pseudouridine synthase A n=1 Tax=hydrothermal vent metagenome TaxID=652676 RepID=A0A1W1D3Q1_9ZZZZ